MEIIRDRYGLTALRLGYSQTGRGERRRGDVTCSLRSPDSEPQEWRVSSDGIGLLDESRPTRSDEGIESGLAECRRYLELSPALAPLRDAHSALWLAVTSEHPLLPGVAWERGLDGVGLPVLRLPARLNTAPAAPPRRARVAVCLSMPRAKASFGADQLVEQVLAAVEALDAAHEVHVFADAQWAVTLRSQLGGRAQVHDPSRSEAPALAPDAVMGERPFGDHSPWLAWIEERMEGRIDVLQLIGHGYLASGQGAFAVAEAPDRNLDRRTARFLWPQQIAALMASTGAWGLVVTAVRQNYSVPGLRLLTSQVAASRAAAAAFVVADDLELTAHTESVYRLLLRYPAPPPVTRDLMLIMHPGRFGLDSPVTTDYQPRRTELADLVESGDDVPAWMVGAQHQVRQWETELSFDSSSRQVESTRTALEVVKERLDQVMRTERQGGDLS